MTSGPMHVAVSGHPSVMVTTGGAPLLILGISGESLALGGKARRDSRMRGVTQVSALSHVRGPQVTATSRLSTGQAAQGYVHAHCHRVGRPAIE